MSSYVTEIQTELFAANNDLEYYREKYHQLYKLYVELTNSSYARDDAGMFCGYCAGSELMAKFDKVFEAI